MGGRCEPRRVFTNFKHQPSIKDILTYFLIDTSMLAENSIALAIFPARDDESAKLATSIARRRGVRHPP